MEDFSFNNKREREIAAEHMKKSKYVGDYHFMMAQKYTGLADYSEADAGNPPKGE